MERIGPAESWLCDLDGVLIRDDQALPGAKAFLERLGASGRPFLVLTNNSLYSPRALSARLASYGLTVRAQDLWTSALAAAKFVASQRPGGTAYVIGEASLLEAIGDVGYRLDDHAPDYVVLGETLTYSYEAITRAIRLVDRGSHLIATNPEPTGPSPEGSLPGCGAVAALIERATGVKAYFVGKPNPLMITEAMSTLDARPHSTVIVGDRMETDVVAGIEAGLETVLVLSGVTSRAELDRFAYRPSRIVDSVADLVREL